MALRNYQRAAADFIQRTPKCAVWASVGTGKTLATLTAMQELLDTFEVARILVIGPPRVVREVWPDEIREWKFRFTHTQLTGSVAERKARLQWKMPEVTFITFDLMRWLKDQFKGKPPPWDMIVIDESSAVAEPSTLRWKAVMPFCMAARRVVELTGTPASNSLQKLWGQMFLLDRGAALGATYGRFINTFFSTNEYTMKTEVKPGMDKTIHRLVAPLVLRIDGADYLDLPPTITSAIKVHLTQAERNQYARLEEEFLIQLETGGTIAASSAGTLSIKLRSFANGAPYDGEHTWHKVHDHKLDALEQLLEELGDEPLLLFYQFISDAERIQQRFPFARRLDDKGAREDFKADKVRLLIAHPASGGHGLNIHTGTAKHTAYFSLPWSLEQYDQSAGRLNGARAKTTSYIHHIICANTIEERISLVLQEKRRTQNDLLAAVKRPLTEDVA